MDVLKRLMLVNTQRLNWRLASVFLSSSIAGLILIYFFHFSSLQSSWLMLSVFFLNFISIGKDRLSQSFWYIIASICFSVVTVTSWYLAIFLNKLWFYPLLFLAIYAILFLAAIRDELSLIATMSACYFVIAVSFHQSGLSFYALLLQVAAPVLIAGCFLILANLLFMARPFAVLPMDSMSYFIKKNLRIALAVTLVYYICHIAGLMHPAWAAITVLVVSRGSLGATIHRAWHRVLGTVAGVLLGFPLVIYILQPYNISGILLLLLVASSFLIIERSYTLGIFLLTLCLGPLYFLLYPVLNQHPLPFIFSRLIVTALGLVVFLLLEMFLFPQSILGLMKKNSKSFWYYLHVSLRRQEKSKQQALLDVSDAQYELRQMHNKLDDCRYEPLLILTDRYHFVLKLVVEMRHLLKLVELRCSRISIEEYHFLEILTEISRKMSRQYDCANKKTRIVYLEDMKQQLLVHMKKKDLPRWVLRSLKNYLKLVDLYVALTKTSRFKLNWYKPSS